jgi:hypothetical protein
VEADGRQPLGERVVDLPRQTRPFFHARDVHAFARQSCALDGDADL